VLKSCLSLLLWMSILISVYWCSSERRSVRSNAFVRVETTICKKQRNFRPMKLSQCAYIFSFRPFPSIFQPKLSFSRISNCSSAHLDHQIRSPPLTHHNSRYCTHPSLDVLSSRDPIQVNQCPKIPISLELICLQHTNHFFQNNKREHQTSDDLTIKQTDSCPLSSNSGYVRLRKVDPLGFTKRG
jgi:hypothetical protein